MKHLVLFFRLTAVLVLSGAATEALGQSMSTTKFFSRKVAGGEPGFGFGFDVKLNEHWIVISEPAFKMGASAVGAVHVFDAATGQPRRVIIDPLAPAATNFGAALALEGDRLLVGSPGAGGAGRVYLFNLRTGALLRTIYAPSINNSEFGMRVDMDGPRAVISDVEYASGGNQTGAVFAYADVASSPTPTMIIPADAAHEDQWGVSVCLRGNLVLGGQTGTITKRVRPIYLIWTRGCNCASSAGRRDIWRGFRWH